MALVSASGINDPTPNYRDGWRGIAWEPIVECVHCGHRVSEPSGALLAVAKKAHRETCPAEKTAA